MTLGTTEGFRHRRGVGVKVEDAIHTFLQSRQVDELSVGGVWDKMHFWWRRFWWRDLKSKSVLRKKLMHSWSVSPVKVSSQAASEEQVLPLLDVAVVSVCLPSAFG